jgi:hypothetical protein
VALARVSRDFTVRASSLSRMELKVLPLPDELHRVNGAHFCIATLRAAVTAESLIELLLARRHHLRIRPSMALDQIPRAADRV